MTSDIAPRTPENMPVGMLARADQLQAAQAEFRGTDRTELLAAAAAGRDLRKGPGDSIDDIEI